MCPCWCISCANRSWQTYHSCYNIFPFYIALNLNWLCNLAECFINYRSSLVVYSQSSHLIFFSSNEVFWFWIIWTQSLCRMAFINITITFSIQVIYLLFHSSVMHYFFGKLRNLRCKLFNHFRYICRFSLTTFIWFFAWMDIFVRWLMNRVIRFSIA